LGHSSQIAERETACFFSQDASRSVRLDLAFEVVAELLGDLAFDSASVQKPAQRGEQPGDHRPSSRMRRIDSAKASHVSVSWFRRFRPARVIV
jgi:hypothetical protein